MFVNLYTPSLWFVWRMFRQHYSNKEDIRVPRDTLMMLGSASHCLLVISINLPKMSDVVKSIYYNIRCSLVVLASRFARKKIWYQRLCKDLQDLSTSGLLQCRSFGTEFNIENITHKHLNNDKNNGIFGMQMCVVDDLKRWICRTWHADFFFMVFYIHHNICILLDNNS